MVATLRRQYMADVIQQAHAHRFKAPEDGPQKQAIVISESWMKELSKHPYFSSTNLRINIFRITWDWDLLAEGKSEITEATSRTEAIQAWQVAQL